MYRILFRDKGLSRPYKELYFKKSLKKKKLTVRDDYTDQHIQFNPGVVMIWEGLNIKSIFIDRK